MNTTHALLTGINAVACYWAQRLSAVGSMSTHQTATLPKRPEVPIWTTYLSRVQRPELSQMNFAVPSSCHPNGVKPGYEIRRTRVEIESGNDCMWQKTADSDRVLRRTQGGACVHQCAYAMPIAAESWANRVHTSFSLAEQCLTSEAVQQTTRITLYVTCA
jgi:hypothetical protein